MVAFNFAVMPWLTRPDLPMGNAGFHTKQIEIMNPVSFTCIAEFWTVIRLQLHWCIAKIDYLYNCLLLIRLDIKKVI